MRPHATVIVVLSLVWAVSAAADESTTTRDLIVGRVVDDRTGQPIRVFHVLPGTRRVRGGESIAIWQPHLIREMTDGALVWPRARGYDQMRLRVEAEGYESTMTEWTGRKQPQLRPLIRLRPVRLMRGKVVTDDGRPVPGAMLSVSLPNSTVRLDGCRFQRSDRTPESLSDWWRMPRMVRCDEEGRFELPRENDPAAVLCVVAEAGYFDQLFADFAAGDRDEVTTVKLSPWGRIEGRVWWRDRPGVGERITLSVHKEFKYPGMIEAYPSAAADDRGRFRFDHVPPGHVQINHPVRLPEGAVLSPTRVRFDYPVFGANIEAGKTVTIDVGGDGIVVAGKLTGLESYEGVTLSLGPPAPDTFSWFKMGNPGGGEDLLKGFEALSNSEYAKHYFREKLPVQHDGTFRIEHVMTGEHVLRVEGAIGTTTFKVGPTETESGALDLGTLPASPLPAGQDRPSPIIPRS